MGDNANIRIDAGDRGHICAGLPPDVICREKGAHVGKIPPGLARWGRQQPLYFVIAVAVYATLWATQSVAPDVLVVLFYSMVLPNLAIPPLNGLRPVHENRSPPYNWIVFAVLMLALSAVTVIVTTALMLTLFADHVRVVTGTPGGTFTMYLRGGWKIPMLALVIVLAVQEAHHHMRSRLERRNRELQQAVASEVAERELQHRELQRAREIQQALLPKEIPQIAGFEVTGAWEPARVVGGDYYDVLRLDENRLAICIADVVGKGVAAALLMASVQATVRAYASDAGSPAVLCSRVNAVLCANTADDKFVTFFYGVLDAERRSLNYCNAGHPPPIVLRHSGRAEQLRDDGGAVLGVFPDWRYQDGLLQLAPGDRLLLFTDGITEAESAANEEFGEERLIEAARGEPRSSADINARLMARVKQFCNSRLRDDATLIVIGVNAATAQQSAGAR
jgi:phosphoserine phosphatase RsbU/P